MRCGKFIVSTFFLAVLTACGDPEPVSTGTKAPGISRASGNQVPATSSSTPGDPAKGQTALTTSCNTCHGKTAHALNKNDVGSMDAAGSKSYHSSVATAFKDSGNDIKAYLATQ
jgi:mono/diheme cytochrome c family protein